MSDGDTQVANMPSQQLQRQDDQKQMTAEAIRHLQAEELDKTLQMMKIEDEALRLALDRVSYGLN